MAQYDGIVIKSGIPTIIGTDTLRANRSAVTAFGTGVLASGDVCQPGTSSMISWVDLNAQSPDVDVGGGRNAFVYHAQRDLFLFIEPSSGNTWTFNPATNVWTNLGDTTPGYSYMRCMVYDSVHHRVLAYGNYNQQNLLFAWDGSWSSLASGGPNWSAACTCSYDPVADVMVVYSSNNRQSWEYNCATNVWSSAYSANFGGGDRGLAAMCFVPSIGKTVLYGGNYIENQTWGYTQATHTWAQLSPTASPAHGHQQQGYVYCPTLGAMVIAGGYTPAACADIWAFDGTTWSRLYNDLPTALINAGLGWDSLRNRFVLGGGRSTSNWRYTYSGTLAPSLAKAANTSTKPIVGVYDGETGSVVKEGVVVATFSGSCPAAGSAVYLSATAGQLTGTKPTYDVLHEVGVVVDASTSKILLQQKPVIVLPVTPPSLWVGGISTPYGIAKFMTADGSYVTRNNLGMIGGVLWDGTRIWAVQRNGGSIWRLDLSCGLIDTLSIDSRALQIAFDGTYVWAPLNTGSNMVKIDSTGAVVGTYAMGISNVKCVCYDGVANVWYTSWNDNNIRKMRCSDGAVVGTYATGIINNTGITTDGTYMYSAGETAGLAGRVSKFLISSGALSGPYDTGGGWSYGITYDENGYIWTNNWRASNIGKVRCSDGVLIGNYAVGGQGDGIAFDGIYLWATNQTGSQVRKFTQAGDIVGTYGNSSQCSGADMLCTTYRVGLP